jgi:hypothetical protein
MKLRDAMLCPECEEVYHYDNRSCRCPRCGNDGMWIQKWITPLPPACECVVEILADGDLVGRSEL